MHRKSKKGNLLLICFPPKVVSTFYTSLSKTSFSFIRSKCDHIKQFGHRAPYLAIPPSVRTSSPHFSLLSETKLGALRTLTRLCVQVPVNPLLDPLTRVKELQNGFMDSAALSQAEPSKAFSLQLYHVWCIFSSTQNNSF